MSTVLDAETKALLDAAELGRIDALGMKIGDYYQTPIKRMKGHNFDTHEEETYYFGGFACHAPLIQINGFGTITDIQQPLK